MCAVEPLSPRAQGADEEFPESTRLSPRRFPDPPRYLYALPKKVTVAATPTAAAAARLGSEKVLFVDLDGNGRFGDIGIDGWRPDAKGFGYLVPVEEAIVLGDERHWLKFDEDGKTLRYRVESPELPEIRGFVNKAHAVMLRRWRAGAAKGLLEWNRLRLVNGLPPVHLDGQLSRDAYVHALYMVRWGVTHKEDPEKEGYDDGGAASGAAASVGSKSADAEVAECYRSFFHRIPLFEPNTRGCGIGTARGATVLDGVRDRRERPWQWPVLIPAPGTEDVPRQFSQESPVAHEEFFARHSGIANAGMPITVTFPRDAVKDVTAELRVDGPKGKPVPFRLSWPGNPAHESRPHNVRSILLLPDAVLSANKRFWVKVTYTYKRKPGERIWSFETR